MQHRFFKYHGTGNDFILIDNRTLQFPKDNKEFIAKLCDRHFGIGADGLILLEDHDTADFAMVYYNADGAEGSLCGNGGRCIVAFAKHLGIIKNEALFMASDGLHQAGIRDGLVSLHMQDVSDIREKPSSFYLDTGSPHHVQLVTNLESYQVVHEGARLRYGIYGAKGSNINFVEPKEANTFAVRTYERGVENETLSCGTGVTAVALAMHHAGKTKDGKVVIETRGGSLQVTFIKEQEAYKNIVLTGPAEQVFQGNISW